ncbi:hypothetical protein [Escherichia phage dw-ec]|nr:hypothetical protein [Escherichia phage BI-EHEC]UJQ43846.1 hypothetical protein [Escherichia phage dw-ec]WPK30666.1 hypothetical protein ETECTG_CDS0151 [Escherichia phage ETEC-TG]
MQKEPPKTNVPSQRKSSKLLISNTRQKISDTPSKQLKQKS